MNVIYQDPHKWSDKSCATCRIVTGLFGFDFGCDRFRKEKANGNRKEKTNGERE